MDEPTETMVIMIIDDTPENLDVLESMLSSKGYKIHTFPRGELALKAAERVAPDLILLDVSMPGMDGFEVCRRLQAHDRLRHIPVVFISAFGDVGKKVEGFQLGGVDYVTKPFHIEEVTARVEVQLKLRRFQQRIEAQNRQLQQSIERQRELEKLKEHLVQMLVHDLKNPLASVIGNSQYALGRIGERTDAGEAMRDVLSSARGMHRMVLNILDVLHLNEARLAPHRTLVRVDQLIAAALASLKTQLELMGRKVIVAVPPDMEPFPLDADLVQRLIENLVENASKYTSAGAAIEVEARLGPDSMLLIEVADQGPGIPEEARERVFEVYARLDRDADIHARASRGLGLAFCRLAAEAHGGRIFVRSNDPKGARFCVEIPKGGEGAAAP